MRLWPNGLLVSILEYRIRRIRARCVKRAKWIFLGEVKDGKERRMGKLTFGMEKSFISLFIITPVAGTISWEPNRRLMVLVMLIAMPDASATEM